MSRAAYPHEPPASPAGHKGLTRRLAEKRNEAIGKTTLLPLVSVPQVADRPPKSKDGATNAAPRGAAQ